MSVPVYVKRNGTHASHPRHLPLSDQRIEPGAAPARNVNAARDHSRRSAIENGPSGFNPAAPAYLSKTHFLMLMKTERLAGLRTSFDQATHTLTIETLATEQRISAELHTGEGRAVIEHFFANYCAGELRGAPKFLHADGHSFSDLARKVVSIINLTSVAAVEDMVGAPVNPLRFRGNLYVCDWPAWYELDLVGKELGIGQARLKSRQAHSALRGDQCRPRHRSSRPRSPASAHTPSGSRRLRHLCRSHQKRRDRTGRQH